MAGTIATVGVLALVGAFDEDRAHTVTDVASGISPDSSTINDIYGRSRDGVVFIQATIVREQRSPFGPVRRQGVSTGTGFVLDDEGAVVTTAHVVQGAREAFVRTDKDSLLPADVVGSDLANDLALPRVDPAKLDADPLPLGDSDRVRVGSAVLALGNPLGLEDTITAGIVSAKQRRITAPSGVDDRGRHPDRCGRQPGQLGRPTARHAGAGDRCQLADRHLGTRGNGLHRHRLRGPRQHGQAGYSRPRRRRRGGPSPTRRDEP